MQIATNSCSCFSFSDNASSHFSTQHHHQVTNELESVCSYKIDRTDVGSTFQPLSIFCPVAGKGRHGSGVATFFSGSSEAHVLSVFLPYSGVNDELKEYLNTVHR